MSDQTRTVHAADPHQPEHFIPLDGSHERSTRILTEMQRRITGEDGGTPPPPTRGGTPRG